MKQFWHENKWYILTVIAVLFLAIGYLLSGNQPENLLPEVYSVM